MFDPDRGTAAQIAAAAYSSREPASNYQPWAHALLKHLKVIWHPACDDHQQLPYGSFCWPQPQGNVTSNLQPLTSNLQPLTSNLM